MWAVSQEWSDALALQRATVEGDETVLAAARAAFRHGYAQGWQAGYDRSFNNTPTEWRINGPGYEQLQRRRREHPEQDPPGQPRPGDYMGGPVEPW